MTTLQKLQSSGALWSVAPANDSDWADLRMTIWYHDRAGIVQNQSCAIQGTLKDIPQEAAQALREGFLIWHAEQTMFVPPSRILEIIWGLT